MDVGPNVDNVLWLRWAIGGLFATFAAFMTWLQVQINQVRREASGDKELLRRELMEAITALREANTIQHTALKDDVRELRDIIDKNREEASTERRRTIDALGKLLEKQAALPDRNEMQNAISALRLDVNTLVRALKDGTTT